MKRIISYIIIPIFVSIIYSRFIDPNLDYTFLHIGNFFASISSNYLNYIYANIGDGIKEIFSYYTYAFTFGISIIFCFFLFSGTLIITVLKHFKKNSVENVEENGESLKNKLKKIKSYNGFKYDYILITIISGAMFIYVISATIKHHYTYNAIIYIEKTLDILAPKIDENTRLQLRAEYRMINTYDKFIAFNNKLIFISKEKKIVIPEFKIIVR